jgi:predicted phosphodiesterase
MKLAIISDAHLGDPLCTLVELKDNLYIPGPKYSGFIDAAGTGNDYLILLGDILDFSVASYENAYAAGKAFFTMLAKDKIAEQIIYVPGNHDYDIWGIVEYEANIIYQIKSGKLPRKFRSAVPGILDDRTNSQNPGFTLPGVGRRANGNYTYGGLFLDHITKTYDTGSKMKGKTSHFVFAYPNIYLVTDNDSVMMTHGQYLDPYWSLLSEWAPIIFKTDLPVGTEMDIAELVGINFPFNQLACSGVGQAGVLSKVLTELQSQIKHGDIRKSKEYLDNFDDYLDKNVFDYKEWYQFIDEIKTDLISNLVKDKITGLIASQKETRYNEQFFNDSGVKKRFKSYYKSSLAEIENLRKLYNISLPVPDTVIFGHTHELVPANDENAPVLLKADNYDVRMYNTGGWLWNEKDNKKEFKGAGVFKYETGKGIRSVSIR